MPSQRNQGSGSGEEASHILETLRAGVRSKGFRVKLDIGKNGRYLFTVFEPNEEGETSRLWEQELPIANEHGKEVGNVAVAVKQVAALDKAWTLVKSVLLKSGQTLAGEDVPSIDRSENSTRGGPQLSGDSGDSDESGKLRLSGWSVINHSREESKTGSWSVVEEPS